MKYYSWADFYGILDEAESKEQAPGTWTAVAFK